MSILLTNIQRFSLHDGPGIRTTVFLKGCSLRCPWCSNPENLVSSPQNYIQDGVLGIYGKYYKSEELVKECLKDKAFYEGKINDPSMWSITQASDIENLPGGITFSGGECLLQMSSLVPVCEQLHLIDIHIVAETCLFVPTSNLQLAINHIDFFYIDMKILDTIRCKDIEHGNLQLYLTNLDILMKSGKPVVVRVPVIGTYTDSFKNRNQVKQLISKYRKYILKIELIKEHSLGESKYRSLNMEMFYHGVEDSLMKVYKDELSDQGICIEICNI